MKLSEIQKILRAELLAGEELLDREVVAAGGADLMEIILSSVAKDSVFLTGVVSEQIIRSARIAGVGALVIVRGKRPAPEIIEMAQIVNLPLFLSNYSMFVSSGRLYMNGLRGLDGSW